MNSLASRNQYQQLGGMAGSKRNCARFRHLLTGSQPNADIAGGMCQHQRYASFTGGREGEMTRLHCPNRQ